MIEVKNDIFCPEGSVSFELQGMAHYQLYTLSRILCACYLFPYFLHRFIVIITLLLYPMHIKRQQYSRGQRGSNSLGKYRRVVHAPQPANIPPRDFARRGNAGGECAPVPEWWRFGKFWEFRVTNHYDFEIYNITVNSDMGCMHILFLHPFVSSKMFTNNFLSP